MSSTISLVQFRANCRFAYNMDANVEGRFITQPSIGTSSDSYLFDVGNYPTPSLRIALGYSLGRSPVTAAQNVSGVVAVVVASGARSIAAATSASSPYISYGYVRYTVVIN